MAIRSIAVFHPQAGVMSAWSCAEGIVNTLAAMGYHVADCGNPDHSFTPIDTLQNVDLIILSGLEWYANSIKRHYGHAWTRLRARKAAWYQESFHGDNRDFDFARTRDLADKHYFPAAQDADEFGGLWLPFGVDTTVFAPKQVEKLYDAAFLGGMYPKRAEYIKRIEYPLSYLSAVSDADQRRSFELLSDAYNSTSIFVNLPSLSRLLVTKVTEVMACRTMLVTPIIDHPSAFRNMTQFEDRKHLVYYSPDRPQDISGIIEHYKSHPDEREKIAEEGWRETSLRHNLQVRLHKIIHDISTATEAQSLSHFIQTVPYKEGKLPAGLYYLISWHLTVLYVDRDSKKIRHASYGMAPMNLVMEIHEDNRCRLILMEKPFLDGHQLTFSDTSSDVEIQRGRYDFDCEIDILADSSIAIRIGGKYLGADLDGVVRNGRDHCRAWEQYRPVRAGMCFVDEP